MSLQLGKSLFRHSIGPQPTLSSQRFLELRFWGTNSLNWRTRTLVAVGKVNKGHPSNLCRRISFLTHDLITNINNNNVVVIAFHHCRDIHTRLCPLMDLICFN